jgi:hypothetical protein
MFAMTAGYCYELIEDLGLLLFGGLPVAPTQRSEDFTFRNLANLDCAPCLEK